MSQENVEIVKEFTQRAPCRAITSKSRSILTLLPRPVPRIGSQAGAVRTLLTPCLLRRPQASPKLPAYAMPEERLELPKRGL